MATDRLHLLLVEDNPQDRELTIRVLKKNGLAARLACVDDGAAALAFLLGEDGTPGLAPAMMPHVVLLDLNLPKVNGLQVLERLRSDPRTRTLPVVVMTSSREDRDLARAYEIGANSYVVKPLDFDEFSAVVGALGIYWMSMNESPPC